MTAKKATVKSLLLELSVIKEELKAIINELKEVKEELKEVKSGKRNTDVEKNSEPVDNNPKKDYDCRKCDLKVPTKSMLRLHIKNSHQKVIKCNYCDEVFS